MNLSPFAREGLIGRVAQSILNFFPERSSKSDKFDNYDGYRPDMDNHRDL